MEVAGKAARAAGRCWGSAPGTVQLGCRDTSRAPGRGDGLSGAGAPCAGCDRCPLSLPAAWVPPQARADATFSSYQKLCNYGECMGQLWASGGGQRAE